MHFKSLALAITATAVLAGASMAVAAEKPATATEQTTTKAKGHKAAADANAFFTKAELKGAEGLNTIKDAKDKFASAKVDDVKGNVLGSIKDIVAGKDGMPATVHIDLGTRVVSIAAKRVNYVQDKDVLYTRMSKAQLEKLKPLKNG